MSNWTDALDRAAADLLRGYLAESGGKAGPAAKAAGINRSSFYGLLKRHNVEFTRIPRSPAPPRNKTNRRLGPKHSKFTSTSLSS